MILHTEILTMQLNEYPTAIAKLQAEVFDLDLLIDQTPRHGKAD